MDAIILERSRHEECLNEGHAGNFGKGITSQQRQLWSIANELCAWSYEYKHRNWNKLRISITARTEYSGWNALDEEGKPGSKPRHGEVLFLKACIYED